MITFGAWDSFLPNSPSALPQWDHQSKRRFRGSVGPRQVMCWGTAENVGKWCDSILGILGPASVASGGWTLGGWGLSLMPLAFGYITEGGDLETAALSWKFWGHTPIHVPPSSKMERQSSCSQEAKMTSANQPDGAGAPCTRQWRPQQLTWERWSWGQGRALLPLEDMYTGPVHSPNPAHLLLACFLHSGSVWIWEKDDKPSFCSSVQSLSRVQLFETPWTAAHQASLSITNSQNVLKFMSI